MAKLEHLRGQVLAELQKRAAAGGDVHRAIQEFEDAEGSRIFYSDGDGEVAMLVPIKDGFEGPDRIAVTPAADPTKIIDDVPRRRKVEVPGVGRFAEYVLSPLQLRKQAKTDGAARPEIGLQGRSEGGETWAPFGFDDQWFREDLPMLVHLATEGGVEVRPDTELDPKKETRRLAPAERALVELALGRRVGEVASREVIEDALGRAAAEDGVLAGAVKSLTMAVTPPAPVEVGSAGARPRLEALLGPGALDPDGYPEGLVRLAEEVLGERDDGASGPRGRPRGARESAVLRALLRGEEVEPAAVGEALDLAFGSGFTATRRVSLELVDQLIDRRGEKLGAEAVEGLRELRQALESEYEAELFGGANAPVRTVAADKKVKELALHLGKGLPLAPALVGELAFRLAAALNTKGKTPAVLIVAGDSGKALDVLFQRAAALLGERVSVPAADLRMQDPVGVLLGSPADEPGIAKGALLRGRAPGSPLRVTIDGVESIGVGCSKDADRVAARRAFFAWLAEVERSSSLKGYDPSEPGTERRVELGQGVVLVRSTESRAELEAAMPPGVWARIAPKVHDFGAGDADTAIASVKHLLAEHLSEAFGLPGAEVELSDGLTALMRDAVASGLPPKQLETIVLDQVAPKLYFAAIDGGLSQRVKVDLSRGMTGKERAKVKAAWLDGRPASLAGLGGSVLTVYDVGTAPLSPAAKVSPKLEAAKAERSELGRLRALVAEYQLGAVKDERAILGLMADVKRARAETSAAEGHIGELRWLNERAVWEIEDLQRLNRIAAQTIEKLTKDLGTANARIDELNLTVGSLKRAGAELEGSLRQAIAERDEIHRALRQAERDMNQAVRSMAGGLRRTDPNAVFADIQASARQQGPNRFLDAMLREMMIGATSAALEQATGHARTLGKFGEISTLARNYLRAAQALGMNPDRRVMDAFEQAARLTGNGWSRNLAQDWLTAVGMLPGTQLDANDLMLGYVARNLLRLMRVRT